MIGKEIYVADHRFKLRSKDDNIIVFKSSDNRYNQSLFGYIVSMIFCVSLTTNSFISGSYACGLFQSMILHILVCILMVMSFIIFFSTWVFGGVFSYQDIWSIAFGKSTRVIPYIIMYVVYLAISFDLTLQTPLILSEVIADNSDGEPSWVTNRWFLVYVIFFSTTFPVLFVRNITKLYGISIFSNVMLLIGTICYIVEAGINIKSGREIILFTSDWKNSMVCISDAVVAYFLNPMMTIIGVRVANPTARRIKGVFFASNGLRLITRLIINCCSYFVQAGSGSLLNNFNSNPVSAIIAKVSLLLASVCSNALITYVLSVILCQVSLPGSENYTLSVISGGIVISTLCMAGAIAENVEMVHQVLMVIASVAACIVAFLITPMIFLKLFRFTDRKYAVMSIALLIIGFAMTCGLIYTGVMRIKEF